jgi:hypothetical protein
MAAVNALFVRAFDLLLAPLSALPPLAGLLVVSLLTAVILLMAFKRTSDQKRLTTVKRAIQAGFFEIRLFADDVPTLLRTQLDMLRHGITYLRLSLLPALWVLVPLAVLVSHLEFHFGYSGLVTGRPALVKAVLERDADSSMSPASMDAPPAVRIDTPAVWLPGAKEVVWRITPQSKGAFTLQLHLADQVIAKTLRVSDAVGRRSPLRPSEGFLEQFLYPSEAPLPAGGPVTSIVIDYPSRDVSVFGWESNWLVVYLAFTMVFMLVLRRPFGVVL